MGERKKFKDKNHYLIFGWMMNRLGLKGNKLIVYAIIYSFTQDGESKYYGGRKYMAEAAASSLPTIDRALQELEAEGYIHKEERDNDGVSHCHYSVFLNDDGEGIKNDSTPYQNDNTPYQNDNTQYNNKNNKKKIINNNKKETVSDLFPENNEELKFNNWFRENFPTLAKNERPLKYKTYIMLLSKYPKEKIILKLNAMEARRNVNKDYSDIGRTLWNWLAKDYYNEPKGRNNKK